LKVVTATAWDLAEPVPPAAKKQWLEDHAIEGDGVGVMRALTGHGEATHSQLDPDEADAAAIAAAALWLLVA